mmetsp:Transcript_11094/g.25124  ORF Transcript_11094/g.25124 Transcript_11094/m.25124 type:complete len:206 (+) Transcript_11094:655-1272(+)
MPRGCAATLGVLRALWKDSEDQREPSGCGQRARRLGEQRYAHGLGVRHLRPRGGCVEVHLRHRRRCMGRTACARLLRNDEVLQRVPQVPDVHKPGVPVPARRWRRCGQLHEGGACHWASRRQGSGTWASGRRPRCRGGGSCSRRGSRGRSTWHRASSCWHAACEYAVRRGSTQRRAWRRTSLERCVGERSRCTAGRAIQRGGCGG